MTSDMSALQEATPASKCLGNLRWRQRPRSFQPEDWTGGGPTSEVHALVNQSCLSGSH
jgi:hypothetical protein